MTNEQILILLRNRYPKVCKEYQNKQCTDGINFCQNLHIYLDLIVGKCKKSETLCGLLHENGLAGKQSARLMQEFNLEQDCFPLRLYYEDIVIPPRFITDGKLIKKLVLYWIYQIDETYSQFPLKYLKPHSTNMSITSVSTKGHLKLESFSTLQFSPWRGTVRPTLRYFWKQQISSLLNHR